MSLRSSRPRKLAAMLTLALFASLALVAVAQAAPSRFYLGELDGIETPAEEFNDACGVFIDDFGDLYVANYGTNEVNIYNEADEYLVSFYVPSNPCGGAVDSKGNVYIANFSQAATVDLYKPSSYPPTATTTYSAPVQVSPEGEYSQAVAVNPANDHIVVSIQEGAQGRRLVEKKSAAEGSGFIRDIAKEVFAGAPSESRCTGRTATCTSRYRAKPAPSSRSSI